MAVKKLAAKSPAKAKVGVLGASGYTGSELVRLLLRHPQRRDRAAHRRPPRRAGDARGVSAVLAVQAAEARLDRRASIGAKAALDLAFCALPHAHHAEGGERSSGQGAEDQGGRPVRRLPAARCGGLRATGTATSITRRSCRRRRCTAWSRCYRAAIKKARLVANPGCYTSCAQLALTPLLKAKAIVPDEIVIDAKSGMTGAGRAAKEEMLFSEVSEGFHAYGVGHHRHMAELDQEFSLAAGREVVVSFTPHLMPMNRGILSTIYVRGTARQIGRGPSCDTFKALREGAVRACAAVRADAADAAMCAAPT